MRETHLPALISEMFDMPRSEARRCIAQGAVRIDGMVTTDMDVAAITIRGARLEVGRAHSAFIPFGAAAGTGGHEDA